MECSALVDVSSSAVLISHGIIHGWKLTQMAYCSLVSAIPELQDFRSLSKKIFWQNEQYTIIHPTFPNNKNNYCEKKACRNSTQNIYTDSFNPVTSKYQYIINNKMQRLILILKTA